MKSKQTFRFIAKFVIGATFAILGIAVSNSTFFNQNPLFNVPFLAEILIGVAAALVGYFLVPKYFFAVKSWVENLIVKTIHTITDDFWRQYMRKMDENRRARNKTNKKKKKKKFRERVQGGVLLDTSMLIDGRILDIAKTGFLAKPVVIPKFVINELHTLSDSKSKAKRAKGRRGLDMINDLKKATKVIIFNQGETQNGVDAELIKVAKECNLPVMTLDFNLNKVAKISNIKILNLNELVLALKPKQIPGDKLKVKIMQEGKEKGQGLGYLDDGTMLVVAGASELLEKEVDVVVSKLIQTDAGRMVFCELDK